MENTSLKIALAALMHDIGKFAQGGMSLPVQYRESNQAIYQPVYRGQYSHQHALYTAAFIEQYRNMLPAVFNKPDWGHGDSFINLAACHHKPETPMQQCITRADRLSSGLDRDTFDDDTYIPFTEYRSTRMVSVLEGLTSDEKEQKKFTGSFSYKTSYELEPLSAFSAFPAARRQISKKEASGEYNRLFGQFLKDVEKLPHRAHPALWGQHFDSLLEIYCSQIPAARVGKVVPDVSLYDHCRTTAAIAVPIYIYHRDNGSLENRSISDDSLEKLLLISGDFYGIQDFIFATAGENQRLRAKLLRGRSFAVSLFSELAAHSICRALGLPFTAVFLNAAGKFHILAANSGDARMKVEQTEAELNRWLFDISCGQASLGVTVTSARPKDFTKNAFAGLWDVHLQNMDRKKYNRIGIPQYGVISNFLNRFDNDLEKGLCPFCGKRPSSREAEKDSYLDNTGSACAICRDHIMLGTNLVKGRNISIFDGDINAGKREKLLSPFYGEYQVRFHDTVPAEHESPDKMCRYWLMNVGEDGSLPVGGTLRLLNGYVPVYEESDRASERICQIVEESEDMELDELIRSRIPKTFNVLAGIAGTDGHGTEALGVLKADVDNLGLMISCGLPEKRFTISRMATLSRRLDQFFSLYLPYLLKSRPEFRNIYTVFAGGDDLFLIGPWNRMAELAKRLRGEWSRYVSGNDGDGGLTFSAGISLHKVHSPVDRMAESAEKALELAKDHGRNRITMFNECVTWKEFDELMQKSGEMSRWVNDDYISNVMLYRFNYFIEQAGKAKQIINSGLPVHLVDMECLKWPALFRYSLERNIRKKGDSRKTAIAEVSQLKNWLEDYGSALKIALWSLLYNQR